jgi:hypothetical protein
LPVTGIALLFYLLYYQILCRRVLKETKRIQLEKQVAAAISKWEKKYIECNK